MNERESKTNRFLVMLNNIIPVFRSSNISRIKRNNFKGIIRILMPNVDASGKVKGDNQGQTQLLKRILERQ